MGRKDEPAGFVFEVDVFESDNVVEAMSTEQVGAYIRLLCKAWREKPPGTIPDDDEILARWARLTPKQWIAARDRVLKAFTLSDDDGRWHQKRMKQTYAELMDKHEQRSAAGSLGNKVRWQNHSKPIAERSQNGREHISEHFAKDRNQKSKSKGISNNQSKVLPSQAPQFDQKVFATEDWRREYSDELRIIGETPENSAFVAQVAWLVCAGAPIVTEVRHALDGINLLRSDGKPPKTPVAYFRGCLNRAVGKEAFDGLLSLAPSQRQCAGIVEAA